MTHHFVNFSFQNWYIVDVFCEIVKSWNIMASNQELQYMPCRASRLLNSPIQVKDKFRDCENCSCITGPKKHIFFHFWHFFRFLKHDLVIPYFLLVLLLFHWLWTEDQQVSRSVNLRISHYQWVGNHFLPGWQISYAILCKILHVWCRIWQCLMCQKTCLTC